MANAWEIPRDEISDEDVQLIKRIASSVVRRRLTTPVIVFLETVRPLNFVGGQILYFIAPMLGWFVPRWDLESLGRVLEKRPAIGMILDEITRLENEQDKGKHE